MTETELSIIVFAFNESENVAPVLAELITWLHAHEPRCEIIFVDDGSTDATFEEAKRALLKIPSQLIRRDSNGGIGAAIKSGVSVARGTFTTFLPCDGQIEPQAIGVLRSKQQHTTADVVLSVYDHRDDGAHRKLLSWGVRTLIRVVHQVRLESDGPYLFRTRLFIPSELPPDTFFLNFEFPIRTLAAGLKTATVTIACRSRRAGTSKSTQWKRVWGVAKVLADLRLRR